MWTQLHMRVMFSNVKIILFNHGAIQNATWRKLKLENVLIIVGLEDKNHLWNTSENFNIHMYTVMFEVFVRCLIWFGNDFNRWFQSNIGETTMLLPRKRVLEIYSADYSGHIHSTIDCLPIINVFGFYGWNHRNSTWVCNQIPTLPLEVYDNGLCLY